MIPITARTEPVPRHDDPLAQAALCSVCPKLCRPTCPVSAATGREAVAPWRISDAVVRGVSTGWTLPLAEQVASCTGCLACAQPCLPGTNLPEESRAARAAAAAGGAPLPAAVALRDRIARTGTPRRAAPGTEPDGSPTLWLGCPTDGTAVPDAARALLAGATTEPPDACCGAVALDLGLDPLPLATRAAALLDGPVVVASPSCARMMRDEWPRLGLTPPPVTTAVEWLASADLPAPVLGPGASPSGAVAWHAPCTLTRALGVVDEGPAVLRRLGYEVREPAATGLATRCSGAGAAYPLVDPGGAAAVAAARRAELAPLDAPVVTACASAARALGATDLLVLAAERLSR